MAKPEKPIQYFSDEYLARCKTMKSTEVVQFLDDFRRVHGQKSPSGVSKLISLKVPEPLLNTFRQRCEQNGVKYQTKIKQLMQDYLQT